MTTYAFKDSGDGYYQIDVPAGDSMPEWTRSLTPCAIQAPIQYLIPLPQQAQAELDKVTGPSGTVIRCVVAGVAVPPAWTTYVQSLRAIVNGTDKTSASLPTQPAYPAGT